MKEHLLEKIKEQEQNLCTSDALERLRTRYKFIQPDNISEYLKRYPFLVADLDRTYEIKCQYFDTSPMLLFYISDIGTLESATLSAYINTETSREKAKDIFSQFEKEWWENMSKDAKKRFMVDIINNV
ncbi:MAG TPA: hypothetical protein VN207_03185 [Ktedonobacteraceae bacterium]|nr:hypothetical protein [Ktedonobacteraceae bacterium]